MANLGPRNNFLVSSAAIVVGVVSYFQMPFLLGMTVLRVCGAIGLGFALWGYWRSRRVSLLLAALCALSQLAPQVEARILEHRVRASLPQFDAAVPVVFAVARERCSLPPGTTMPVSRCNVYEGLPPQVRDLATRIEVNSGPRIFFWFRRDTRQHLLYDPTMAPQPKGPYRKIGNEWHLFLG